MKLSLAYKQDILALAALVQQIKLNAGETWSDTTISKHCFGHGEFVHILRAWQGGRGGPTFDKVMKFEQFCREQIGEREYDKFRKERQAAA